MKTIINKILFIIFLTSASAAQTDSIMYLKETNFSLYNLHKVKYQCTGETVMEKEPMNLENVKTLTFLSNDSLILIKNSKLAVGTRLSHIDEVTKYKHCFSPVSGTAIGAVGGLLFAGCLIWAAGTGDAGTNSIAIVYFSPPLALIIGAAGGFIGAVITNAINHSTLDLTLVPDKDKKVKLIRFLKQK